MHYRMTKVHHHADARQKMIDHLSTMDDLIRSIEGLKNVKLIKVSDTSSMAISEYDNEQQVVEAEEKFNKVMAGMMQFMTAPPEINNGDVFWQSNQ